MTWLEAFKECFGHRAQMLALRRYVQGLLSDSARTSGFTITGVLADAECGDNGLFRAMLHRLRLPYAVGISSHLTVFRGTPCLHWPTAQRGRRKHPECRV